jgi:superfamily II DNA or RNA helicase
MFTYPAPLAGAKPQAVATSDRPWCSLINCLATPAMLTGYAKALSIEQRVSAIHRALATYDVPEERAVLWAQSLNGHRLPKLVTAQVGPITLDVYQVNAIARMTLAGGVMALSCGLGKTPAAIAAALSTAHRARLWIVCPINAFPTWRRWVPFLQEHFKEVRIISMDSLHKVHPEAATGGCIIYDEVHLLGVLSAKRTKEAHRIRRAFDFGLCLTGTLLHGGIEKTLSILDLAVPGLARFANRWAAGEYFNCLVKKQFGARKVTALERPAGKNRESFFAWLSFACVSYNRDSDEVQAAVSIPEQTVHRIKLGEPWEPLHELAANVALAMLETDGKLPDAAKVAHHLCRFGVEAKIAWLFEAMKDNDEPVVVCAEYTDSLDSIEAALKEAGITYGRVDGAVTGSERQDIQRRFQAGEIRVFLGQMDASTTSLDLDRACISVGVDHTWKAANYDQFLGRTARRTQKRECHHYDLVANQLQDKVVGRVQEHMDFDAKMAEWADLKRAIGGVQ